MNFNCTRLILRSFSRFIKAHCSKLYEGLPGTSPRFFLSAHSRCISWQRKDPQDSKDDFELFENTIEYTYKDVDIEKITGGDPEKAKILQVCQSEIDVLVYRNGRVPKTISTEQWIELIKLPSRTQRARYLSFLWHREENRKNSKLKKLGNHHKHEKFVEIKTTRGTRDSVEIPTNSPVKYGLCDTSLMHRIRDQQINKFYNYKLLQAMQYGPHILVDCGYEDFMNPREIRFCTEQLELIWYENRDNKNPFDVIFCNFKDTSSMFQKLRKKLVGIDTDPAFPFNHTDKHYLDLFPKENLVYLTPHCKEYLEKFDGNDIYIIGAMVEESSYEPVSIAKAKKDQIRYAKLPLDLHLNWKQGKKSLNPKECLAIMNDVKDGKDWSYAFRHVIENKPKDNTASTTDEKTREIRDIKHRAKFNRKKFRRNEIRKS